MTDDVIIHYGKKGMKWGVRKDRSVRARAGDDESYVTTKAAKKTPVRQLTNAQLKKANERMQLEKTYKDLSSQGATRRMKQGAAIVSAITAGPLAAAGVYNLVTSPAGKAAIATGSKLLKKGMQTYAYSTYNT